MSSAPSPEPVATHAPLPLLVIVVERFLFSFHYTIAYASGNQCFTRSFYCFANITSSTMGAPLTPKRDVVWIDVCKKSPAILLFLTMLMTHHRASEVLRRFSSSQHISADPLCPICSRQPCPTSFHPPYFSSHSFGALSWAEQAWPSSLS